MSWRIYMFAFSYTIGRDKDKCLITLNPVGFGWKGTYLKLCIYIDIYSLVLDCVCIMRALKASKR
ncbi:hypothetical protein Bca4012_090033 [Brassica carinata]